jgi:hypothetical protein
VTSLCSLGLPLGVHLGVMVAVPLTDVRPLASLLRLDAQWIAPFQGSATLFPAVAGKAGTYTVPSGVSTTPRQRDNVVPGDGLITDAAVDAGTEREIRVVKHLTGAIASRPLIRRLSKPLLWSRRMRLLPLSVVGPLLLQSSLIGSTLKSEVVLRIGSTLRPFLRCVIDTMLGIPALPLLGGFGLVLPSHRMSIPH